MSTMAKVDGVPNPKNQATFLSCRTNHLQHFAIQPQGSLSILLAGSTDGNGKVMQYPAKFAGHRMTTRQPEVQHQCALTPAALLATLFWRQANSGRKRNGKKRYL